MFDSVLAMIDQDSIVELYKDVPISMGHQLIFSTKNKQLQYFDNKRVLKKTGCSYIRKTGRVKLEYNTNAVKRCNYMSFYNPSFENIRYYAIILDFNYINNETTEIEFQMDWWQTYMFDASYHACSILREHLTEADWQKALKNPWRYDVADLYTDEGLSANAAMEHIYTQGRIASGTFTGNRSQIPDDSTILSDPKANDKYITFQISQFDIEAIKKTVDKFEETFLNSFDYFGGNFTTKPTTINDFFTSWNSEFIRPTALLGVKFDITGTYRNKINAVLEKMTIGGITGQIQGVYVLPRWALKGYFTDGDAVDLTEGFTDFFIISPNKNINPKLNRFPFHYLRVKSPAATKEYQFELFNKVKNNDLQIDFEVKTNTNGVPVFSFAPIGYKNNSDSANYFERIEFSDFPQASYSTDAYLSFLSSQYQGMAASGTVGDTLSQFGNAVGSAVHDVVNVASLGTLGAVESSVFREVPNKYGYNDINRTTETAYNTSFNAQNLGAASSFRTGNAIDNMNLMSEAAHKWTGSSAVYDMTKQAYANDNYHAGSGTGYLAYAYHNINFTLELVGLNPTILKKYSDYLNIYGYKSARTDVPHVCDYIKNGKNAPHFEDIDSEKLTYVQTENMHVTGLPKYAIDYIENMFNAGCRFIKGDIENDNK